MISKRIRRKLFKTLLILFLALISTSLAQANSNVFPLPMGKQTVTNDYEGHNKYLKHQQYSLDLQVGEIPKTVVTPVKKLRCYTYGEPILAAKNGKIIKVVSDNRQHDANAGYGTNVRIKHDDGSISIYGHMIFGTNKTYVKIGEEVKAGQILGLMGDTGYIISSFKDDPCEKDDNFGTHLHFETRKLKDNKGKSIPLEPLGRKENNNFKAGSKYISETVPYDPKNTYIKNHAGQYPYILEMQEVHWLTPLQTTAGENETFRIKGANFHEGITLKLNLCKSQRLEILDEEHAEIKCGVKNIIGMTKYNVFQNMNQADGITQIQIDILKDKPFSKAIIEEVNYIPPKPGEFLNLHILGANLPGNLFIEINDSKLRNRNGSCDNGNQFEFLSPVSIRSRCRLPLNIGAVKHNNNRVFNIKIYENEIAKQSGAVPLYRDSFGVNYGISAVQLNPTKARYYIPTRFSITGKNVHRTTVFFVEGCEKKDLKILHHSYNEVTFECLIRPLPGTNLKTLEGKTFQHYFILKTRSKYNRDGKQQVNDKQDQENTILSGYISLSYDFETRIENINPTEAIIGTKTTFTIEGNNLPYSNEKGNAPLIWLAYCPGDTKDQNIEIIPESYTPYAFKFQCTPQFTEEENKAYRKLEDEYNTDDREKKKALWPRFDDFFKNLEPRQLHVKEVSRTGKKIISKQKVRFISSLYRDILHAESFQFDYERKDGKYNSNRIAKVLSMTQEGISRKKRRQKIIITGENLPYETKLVSDDCDQIVTTFGSSDRFEFVCLLKKVARANYQIIDSKKKTELYKRDLNIKEVYTVDIRPSTEEKDSFHIFVNGVNLSKNTQLSSTECKSIEILHSPSTSELSFLCKGNFSVFTKPKKLNIKITSKSGFPLYSEDVPIDEHLPVSLRVGLMPEEPDTQLISTSKPKVISAIPKPITKASPLFSIALMSVECNNTNNPDFFLGECNMYSDFVRRASMLTSYDKVLSIAVLEGQFDTTIDTALDAWTGKNIKGLKLNPAAGEGLLIVDIENPKVLMSGEIQAMGFDVENILGFPFNFDLYDFRGNLALSFPRFDVKKSRAKSNIVFGIGDVSGIQVELLKKKAEKLKDKIQKEIHDINTKLNQKKLEIGAKLMNSIENTTIKKLARKTYIQVLKALEIEPEEIAFYDNLDLIIRGKLKSEPFRPKNWGENQGWITETNLATVEADFTAKEGKLSLRGDVLNSFSLFNNDIIKADRGLINAGITINLTQDHGRVDIERIEIRLPKDLVSVKANAHITNLLKPDDISVWGALQSQIKLFDLKAATAGAAFFYDPNSIYDVEGGSSQGTLSIETMLELIIITARGKSIITVPNNEVLIDIGGSLDLDFLGTHQRLGDILGRLRVNKDQTKACINSQTGKIILDLPSFVSKILGEKTIIMKGDISISGKLDLQELSEPSLISRISPLNGINELSLTGQITDKARIGFQYDASRNLLSRLAFYTQKCSDTPGEEFFERSHLIAYNTKTPSFIGHNPLPSHPNTMNLLAMADPTSFSEISNPIVIERQIITENTEKEVPLIPETFNTLWDVEGWIILSVTDGNGNRIIITDEKGKEHSIETQDDTHLPGVDIYPANNKFHIYDKEAFENSGYTFQIIKNNHKPIELTITNFTNNTETDRKFNILDMKNQINTLSIEKLQSEGKISINGNDISATKTDIKPITANDRKTTATVSSETSFDTSFPNEGLSKGHLPLDKPMEPSTELFPDIRSPILSEAINFLVQAGIINGYEDNTFRPEEKLNRAEALKIIFAAQGITADSDDQSGFTDIARGQWYAPYVTAAKKRGIINGYADGSFRAGQQINKAEFIKIAMAAQKEYEEPENYLSVILQYSDLDTSQWYMPYLTYAFDRGYLNKTRYFKPTKGMSRGEAALIIYRIMQE